MPVWRGHKQYADSKLTGRNKRDPNLFCSATWPEAVVLKWQRIDWGYVKDQVNISVIVDAVSVWKEAFPVEIGTSGTVKTSFSQIFARFGIPRTLVSDNGPDSVSGYLKLWRESLGVKKIESPVYQPRANGLAGRACQTVKRALQALSPNLNISLGAFLKWTLVTRLNTSKTRGKTPVELLLGRRVRLPANADLDLCEAILLKVNEKTKTVPSTFIIRKCLNTSFIQPENSTQTIRVSDDQVAWLYENNMKMNHQRMRPFLIQNHNFRTQMWDLYIEMKLLQPHQLQSTNNPNHHKHPKEIENNPTDMEKLNPQTCLKKEADVIVSKKHQEN